MSLADYLFEVARAIPLLFVVLVGGIGLLAILGAALDRLGRTIRAVPEEGTFRFWGFTTICIVAGAIFGAGAILLMNKFAAPLSLRLPVKELGRDQYFGQVSQCTAAFLTERSSQALASGRSTMSITYADAGGLEFSVDLDGRGPYLALRDRGYRERLGLRVSISRPFDWPERAQVDVTVVSARQTPWPDNEQTVDNSKFTPFGADQGEMLEKFSKQYGTFLSQCIGRDVGPQPGMSMHKS